MFNKEFYPTPLSLINKMISNIDFNLLNSILEPSAGKGDILDVIKEKLKIRNYYRTETYDIDTIENDENLIKILKGKEYRVIHNDFLKFNTFKQYDLIIMNPPFSNGDKHLLKALELQKSGGAVICILNAETLKNPYSNERKILVTKLKELNADIEYLENEFTNAENKTNVEIALIKVFIPTEEKPSYIFEQLENEEQYFEEINSSEFQVVKNDLIEEIVKQYQLEIQAGIKLIKEYNAMKPFILRKYDKEDKFNDPILKLTLEDKREVSINEYICKTRYKYWEALFNNPNFTKRLTTNLIQEYHNRISELQNYDFSVYNIYQIQLEMSKNLIKGVGDTIIKLFDELSYQYTYSDELSKNIHYFTGWKTNKSWFINKRVIIPYMSAFTSWSGDFRPDYGVSAKLRDIEKSLNYLDGNKTLDVDLDEQLQLAKINVKTSKIPLKYFNVTFYKKGTCHLEFTNLELLKKFNIYGCQNKKWLPPSYGKKCYEDMEQEEKNIINDFEGEESYKETFINKDYYIPKSEDLLLLGVD